MQVSADITAQPNTTYEVNAAGAGPVSIRLPQVASAGDTVSVRGVSNTAWRLVTNWAAQPTAVAPQLPITLGTTALGGNTVAGTNWTPHLNPKMWHWIATDPYGSLFVATDIPGQLWLSKDAGGTWDPLDSPAGQAWITASIARTPGTLDPDGFSNTSIVAAAYQGNLYRYNGSGWTQLASGDPAIDLANREWESVVARVGGGIVGAILNGPIYYSNDGAHWAAATAAGAGTPLVRGWRALAGQSAGMAAASQDGEVWVSTDAGQTWTQRSVFIGGQQVYGIWYRIACNADCSTIAVAGRFDNGMYISRDRGLTWTQAPTPVGDYTAIAMSSDAQTIVATITDGVNSPTVGSVQVSRDGGAHFSAPAMPGTQTNWRAVAMAADAASMAIASGTFTERTGQLYTSIGNRASYPDVPGWIAAGQGASVIVEYAGSSRWNVKQSSGTFSIH